MNVQLHNFRIDEVGTGFLFSSKRAYFAYNAKNKSLEVVELNLLQRVLRTLFGTSRETHLSYVLNKVGKRMTKDGLELPSEITSRLHSIWQKAYPNHAFPLQDLRPKNLKRERFIQSIDSKAIRCKDLRNVRQIHDTRKKQIAALLSFLEKPATQDHIFVTIGCGDVPEHTFPGALFDALLSGGKSVHNIIFELNSTDFEGSRIWELLQTAYNTSILGAPPDTNWDTLCVDQFLCGHPSGTLINPGWRKEDIIRFHQLFEKYLEQALLSGKEVTIGWSRGDPLSEEVRATYNRLQARFPTKIHLWYAYSGIFSAVAKGQIETKLSFKDLTSEEQMNQYLRKALRSEFTFLTSMA